jgi:hypothetical protein
MQFSVNCSILCFYLYDKVIHKDIKTQSRTLGFIKTKIKDDSWNVGWDYAKRK